LRRAADAEEETEDQGTLQVVALRTPRTSPLILPTACHQNKRALAIIAAEAIIRQSYALRKQRRNEERWRPSWLRVLGQVPFARFVLLEDLKLEIIVPGTIPWPPRTDLQANPPPD
jgi:hypothetical protein